MYIPYQVKASAYKNLLRKYVNYKGMVNYRSMFRDRLFKNAKQQFKQQLARTTYGNRLKALLINAYNFYVMERIRQFYPLKKVIDIKRFFTSPFIPYRGKYISLNRLEKQILFKKFRDPLLHFVLVCGAKSCPPLKNSPYTAYGLNYQLRRQTKLFLNSKDGLYKIRNILKISKLFQWYKGDFGGSNRKILHFIKQYNKHYLPYHVKIKFLYYNWALNGW